MIINLYFKTFLITTFITSLNHFPEKLNKYTLSLAIQKLQSFLLIQFHLLRNQYLVLWFILIYGFICWNYSSELDNFFTNVYTPAFFHKPSSYYKQSNLFFIVFNTIILFVHINFLKIASGIPPNWSLWLVSYFAVTKAVVLNGGGFTPNTTFFTDFFSYFQLHPLS